jgi:hypothetical protein
MMIYKFIENLIKINFLNKNVILDTRILANTITKRSKIEKIVVNQETTKFVGITFQELNEEIQSLDNTITGG